ncbi:conserved protein of unknown function [Candidatus Nitrosocosmicus franklandus]|uniref:Uncharacterized protein n=2 Tax=Candidatus Nitrosocosmicus franklandianus TaxID=1798806 RepID=A0A484I911_9ARCH|nr:conserved protein of unknown function [Candidatus Nitrosocosmicus franklandus]
MKKNPGLQESKQMSFENCLINNFKEKLFDLSRNVAETGKPVVLYTTLLDEVCDYGEQELAIVNEDFVVIQVITFGGYVPIAVQHQRVFTFDEFAEWIFERSDYLFIQCFNTLDDALVSIH